MEMEALAASGCWRLLHHVSSGDIRSYPVCGGCRHLLASCACREPGNALAEWVAMPTPLWLALSALGLSGIDARVTTSQ